MAAVERSVGLHQSKEVYCLSPKSLLAIGAGLVQDEKAAVDFSLQGVSKPEGLVSLKSKTSAASPQMNICVVSMPSRIGRLQWRKWTSDLLLLSHNEVKVNQRRS